ncbi:MAG TPA: hypothetical protein ENJ28_07660 [Gammaproteobacteria bacterium]|nr:hypothetical protein [Gammaproteobacteria bacterium]
MKAIETNNYAWLDIIEPEQITSFDVSWQILLIILSVVMGIYFISRYFRVILRFKLWFIHLQFKKELNERDTAIKILHLLKLSKNTDYLMHNFKVDDKAVKNYRLMLLEACFANTLPTENHIKNLLKTPVQWL